jgi:hypothetical protein
MTANDYAVVTRGLLDSADVEPGVVTLLSRATGIRMIKHLLRNFLPE